MVSLAVNILKAIENTYKKKYVGVLKVKKLQPFGYSISLGLNTPEKPIVIAAQIDNEEDFIKFFIQELRVGRFHEVKYFSTYRNVENTYYKHTYSVNVSYANEEVVVYPPTVEEEPDEPKPQGYIEVTPTCIYLNPDNNFTCTVEVLSNIIWNI